MWRITIKLILLVLVAFTALIAVEVIAAIRQPLIPFKNPDRLPVRFGRNGSPLNYLVLGDSTAAGQGAAYNNGIAMETARYLSQDHTVTFLNMAVSGARAADVVNDQLQNALSMKPDVVLISVGANDATHFTPSSEFAAEMRTAITMIKTLNPNVKIIVTGCPDLGSVPRFAQPLRWFAGTQTERLNNALLPIVYQQNVIYADIAGNTGPEFRRDPSLFASDHFHPNTAGYQLWTSVLNREISTQVARP